MHGARGPACRIGVLETPGAFGEGRSSDKEARSEFPPATCDSDLKHVSPCYQHVSLSLNYPECTKADSAHVECGCLRLLGVSGREGAVTKKLEVSLYALHAPQT